MASRSPSVASLSFSPDGTYLVWLSNDSQLRLWDRHRVLPALQLPGARHLSVSPTAIAVSDDVKPIVRFIDPATFKLLPHVSSDLPHNSAPIVALSPPYPSAVPHPRVPFRGVYAVAHQSSIRIRSYSGETLAEFNTSAVVFCAAFDAKAERLAVGDNKGNIHVWHFRNSTPTSQSVRAHKSFVSSLFFFPDGTHLLSGGWDGRAQLWDLSRNLAAVASMRPEGKARDKVFAVAVSEGTGDQRLISVAGTAGAVRVWRTNGPKGERRILSEPNPIATHMAHSSSVYALAFSPDGKHVASGSGDGTVRLFGIPSKPLLVSHPPTDLQRNDPTFPHSEQEGMYHIKPLDVLVKGQRPDRQLIFCPSNVVTLSCPICANAYDPVIRVPICSGSCGHTFACKGCNERLWNSDGSPSCPICRTALVDVVPNYELLRILAAANGSSSSHSDGTDSNRNSSSVRKPSTGSLSRADYVQMSRLSWIEAPELAYMTRHNCTVYRGKMDGEVVGIRLPSIAAARDQSDSSRVQMTETERHIACLKKLRGPHITQLYGVSRTEAPDNKIVVVSELPTGGTLAHNLASLKEWGRGLPSEAVLSLSLQLVKTLRFLHQSDTSAGWALSPESIALAMPVRSDWAVQHRVKLIEMGGTISKAECSADINRVFPSDYIPYMAPEMLDEDRSGRQSREEYFQRMCQSDMYSLGVVLWEVCSGERPFDGYRPAQVVAAVLGRGARPGYPPSTVPTEVQTLISRLWSQKPGDRPTAREACELLETVPSAPPL